MNKSPTDQFIEKMQQIVRERQVLSPADWLEKAFKLNLFRSEDIDIPMYELEHKLAQEKADTMAQPDMTNAKAEAYMKAKPEYQQLQVLKAKEKQVVEFIRIAKQMSRAAGEEYNGS